MCIRDRFNAALWMGGSIFFSFLAGSVFFSPEVMRFTPPPYNGLVAQAMLERFFLLHYICGGIAIVHLFADWLEKPGTFPKKPIFYVVVLLGLALVGGKWISPKLTIWHQQKYEFQVKSEGPPPMIEPKAYSNEVRQDAKLKFSIWHGRLSDREPNHAHDARVEILAAFPPHHRPATNLRRNQAQPLLVPK